MWSSDPSLQIEALEGARRVPLDGYFALVGGRPAWRSSSLDDLVHFIAFFREDLGEAEFMIPLVGKEGAGLADLSDLNVQVGNLPGVHFQTSVGIYPIGSSKWVPTTWARLRLNN